MSWHAVADADGYIVTFSQTQGGDHDGHYPTDSHTARQSDTGCTSVSIAVGGDVL